MTDTASSSQAPKLGGGRYVVEGLLGTGGMAEVYLGQRVGTHGFTRKVVIKRILSELSENTEYVTRFMREAMLASQLHHPNIVEVLDFGDEDGEYYMVMEYLQGKSARIIVDRLNQQKQRCPHYVAARVLADVASALEYAHHHTDESGKTREIIHRDVALENIMVTFQGHVKLLDFGIARDTAGPQLTQVGDMIGKPHYFSPEVLDGTDPAPPRDLYSLGICAYMLFSGRAPFSPGAGSDVAKLLHEIMTVVPPPLTEFGVPEELSAIVASLLDKDPAKRPTANQACQQFTQYLNSVGKAADAGIPDLLSMLFSTDADAPLPVLDGGLGARPSTIPELPSSEFQPTPSFDMSLKEMESADGDAFSDASLFDAAEDVSAGGDAMSGSPLDDLAGEDQPPSFESGEIAGKSLGGFGENDEDEGVSFSADDNEGSPLDSLTGAGQPSLGSAEADALMGGSLGEGSDQDAVSFSADENVGSPLDSLGDSAAPSLTLKAEEPAPALKEDELFNEAEAPPDLDSPSESSFDDEEESSGLTGPVGELGGGAADLDDEFSQPNDFQMESEGSAIAGADEFSQPNSFDVSGEVDLPPNVDKETINIPVGAGAAAADLGEESSELNLGTEDAPPLVAGSMVEEDHDEKFSLDGFDEGPSSTESSGPAFAAATPESETRQVGAPAPTAPPATSAEFDVGVDELGHVETSDKTFAKKREEPESYDEEIPETATGRMTGPKKNLPVKVRFKVFMAGVRRAVWKGVKLSMLLAVGAVIFYYRAYIPVYWEKGKTLAIEIYGHGEDFINKAPQPSVTVDLPPDLQTPPPPKPMTPKEKRKAAKEAAREARIAAKEAREAAKRADAEAKAQEEAAKPPKTGKLVITCNWGFVMVNGQTIGTCPIRPQILEVGEHVVQWQGTRGVESKSIRIRKNRTTTLKFGKKRRRGRVEPPDEMVGVSR